MRTIFRSPSKSDPRLTLADPYIRKVAVISAVILLSALVAWVGPSRRLAMMLVSAGPAFVAFLIYLKEPNLGLLALVAAALLVPINIGTGTGTSLNPVILLVPVLSALWLAKMILRERFIVFHKHGSVYLILALSAIATLSLIVGQLSWFDIPGAGGAAQFGGLMVFIISAAAFLLAAHSLNKRWLRRLVYLFVAIGALIVIARLVPPVGSLALRFVDRGAQGSVFWIWLVSLSVGMALFNYELPGAGRFLLAFVALLTLASGIIQTGGWAAGWAPPLVAALLLLWIRFPRWGWIVVLVAVVAFIFQFDRFWFLVTDNESWLARWQAWRIVLDTISTNPLLGLGPSNYYFYVQEASIFGWGGAWNVKFSSHNNWVDLLAQTGIIGTAIFILFSISIGRVGIHLYRRLPNGFSRAYAAACLAGLIATLVSGMLGDWFLPFVYNIGLAGLRASVLFWVFLGGLLALYKETLETEES